jgi:hypothetical protein
MLWYYSKQKLLTELKNLTSELYLIKYNSDVIYDIDSKL